MDNKLLDGVIIFTAIVEHGGFGAAAKALNVTPSHVSKEVIRLEERLGTRLMNRTTRKFSLTESGLQFFESGRRITEDAKTTLTKIVSAEQRPFGHLRTSVPVMFSDACLNHWLPEFIQQYPDITHDIEVSDRYVDIVGEGLDLIVRAGSLDDSDFIATKLMTTRRLTIASPNYLEANGTPGNPSALMDHRLIDFAHGGTLNQWHFRSPDGSNLAVSVKSAIRCNNANMELALAGAGMGITRIPHLAAREMIEDGLVVPILTEYENPPLELHAIYPSRQYLPPKARLFIDFLSLKCRQLS